MVQLSVLTVASSFLHTDLPGPLGEELVVIVVGHNSQEIMANASTTGKRLPHTRGPDLGERRESAANPGHFTM